MTRHPEACDDMLYGLPSSLTSEVGNTPVDIYIATEEATGSASAEVVGSAVPEASLSFRQYRSSLRILGICSNLAS